MRKDRRGNYPIVEVKGSGRVTTVYWPVFDKTSSSVEDVNKKWSEMFGQGEERDDKGRVSEEG